MATSQEATWNDIKAKLAQLDRAGLLGLVKDLHALRPENRAFLAARFSVDSDPLEPFKTVISRWVNPDVMKRQDVSVAKAKKAIAEYRKAVGRPTGMAELCIFYCEEAARLIGEFGMEDDAYYAALVRTFDQSMTHAFELLDAERDRMLQRLDAVRASLQGIGWGVSDAVNEIWYDRID